MTTEYKHLKPWTRPQCYAGPSWDDYYVIDGRHRDSDTLTESNWACWEKFMNELLGDESAVGQSSFLGEVNVDPVPGWVIIRESHWAVGWVEWMGVHKDAPQAALDKIEAQLARLDGYPIFDEGHYSALEQAEYDKCFTNLGAASDWGRVLVKRFADCGADRVTEWLTDTLDWQEIQFIHEVFTPSGEYWGEGCWPHIEHSVDRIDRDDLANLARIIKYHRDTLYTAYSR